MGWEEKLLVALLQMQTGLVRSKFVKEVIKLRSRSDARMERIGVFELETCPKEFVRITVKVVADSQADLYSSFTFT